MKNKYIYALDLSLNSTGVCIFTTGGEFISAHTIDTNKEKETKIKLHTIGKELIKLKKRYLPEIIVMEQGFTLYNQSTQSIFRVHGVVNYIFYQYEQIYYPASTIKKVVGGKGNMSKEEIRNTILKKYPDLIFKNYDESDAFSVGMTFFIKKGIYNAEVNVSKNNNK